MFRKRGRIKKDEIWHYNNQQLSIVDSFNYLGVNFNYNGTFVLNVKCLKGKALKAMYTLLNNTKKLNVRPDIAMQLFDSFVGSILNYGSAVWGFTKSKDLERIHLQFCKSILGVKQSTSNAAIYGELGRCPLYISRYVFIMKFWLKLHHSKNSILRYVYDDALNRHNNGVRNWVSNVKLLLDEFGFTYVFDNPKLIDGDTFIEIFKKTVTDCFVQKWYTDVSNNSILSTLYTHLNTNFSFQDYLSILYSFKLRSCITRMRISAHNLFIESQRYGRNRKDRCERKCVLCSKNDIEDEYHFILICDRYNDIREKFISNFYFKRPSVVKLLSLLNSTKKSILVNLGKYISIATERRNSFI